MNPLPFFPPPARAFSHANNSNCGNSTSSNRQRTKSGSAATSLRHTLSLTGGISNIRGRNPSAGASASPGTTPTSAIPPHPHHISRPSTTASAAASGGGPIRRVFTATSAIAASSSTISARGTTTASSTAPPRPLFGRAALQHSSSSSSSSSSSPSSSSSLSPSPTTAGRVTPEVQAGKAASSHSNANNIPSSSSLSSSSVLNIRKPLRSSTLPLVTPSGRTGTNLPKGLTFDWVRPHDVSQCYALEKASYDADDAAPKDRIVYRQKNAPHLFLGAYIPGPATKVAGPLSVGLHSSSRKLIGFINATAAANLSARAMAEHAVSDHETGIEAWLVCLHSIVVDDAYRHRGLGLRMLEEYMARLRRAEEGRGERRRGDLEIPRGYECVALLSHEETLPFFLKAGFNIVGPSHVRSGSGEWIELRRYIHNSHQKMADERRRVQEEELEQQKQLRRVASETAAAAAAAPPSTLASSSSMPSYSGQQGTQSSSLHLVLQQADGVQPWNFTASPTASEGSQHSPNTQGRDEQLGFSVPESGKSASGSSPDGMAAFSQADLLAALSASAPSFKPGDNPSKPFSTILGQTLAGKTFVEDAFIALEARLVDRGMQSNASGHQGASDSQGTNLMEIWCPRENCGCKLIGKGRAMWELAESGPLSQPELVELHLPRNSATLPSTPQPPPAPASHIRALTQRKDGSSVRSSLPGAPPSAECMTPIRPFWSVCSAMSFDNIGFSKDVQWKMPTSSDFATVAGALSGTGSGGEDDDDGGKRRKSYHQSVRRPTFRNNSGQRKTSASSRPMSPTLGPGASSTVSPGFPMPSGSPFAKEPERAPGQEAREALQLPQVGAQDDGSDIGKLTVKYLLCPNCDTGPLGYTIVPKRLTGGRMGLEVGEELGKDQQRAGSGDGGGQSMNTSQDIQVFLLAAERVRYRAIK